MHYKPQEFAVEVGGGYNYVEIFIEIIIIIAASTCMEYISIPVHIIK